MTAPTITSQLDPSSVAVTQWRRRVFRISSLCEIFFGSIWASNAIRSYLPFEASLALLAGLVVFAMSIRATRGTAPRPAGSDARALEHRITVASVVQIVAAIVLPVALVATGHGTFVMPVIVASVGVLFVWLDREVHLVRLRVLGTALVLVPVVTTIALSGTVQTTSLLAVAGTLMVATGVAGVRTLH